MSSEESRVEHQIGTAIGSAVANAVESGIECAICLQRCIHAVRLPCAHIFCYLCVKGASNQSKRCAMCRREIPENYFDAPQLIDGVNEKDVHVYDDLYRWYYEGRDGWWLYDSRTSDDIESAFKRSLTKCELLIAGFLYVIDFARMTQYRRNEPHRVRRIKRDRPDTRLTKGVAGLKTRLYGNHNSSQQTQRSVADDSQTERRTSSSEVADDTELLRSNGEHSHSSESQTIDRPLDDIRQANDTITTISDNQNNSSNSSIQNNAISRVESDLNELAVNIETRLNLSENQETHL